MFWLQINFILTQNSIEPGRKEVNYSKVSLDRLVEAGNQSFSQMKTLLIDDKIK